MIGEPQKPRVILDTNIIISYTLKPSHTLTKAVHKAFDTAIVLISQNTYDEVRRVIERFVTRGYVSIEEASAFLGRYAGIAEWIKILETVQLCRDPADDMFLELALNGRADYLVTGDADLLVLHPYKGTAILTPAGYVNQ